MINHDTIDAVYPLAQKLANKGITVDAIHQTPLASLVGAANYPVPKGLDTAISTSDRLLAGSTSKDVSGVCQHDLVMDEIVDVVAKTVERNLNLSKTVVNPIVKSVAEKAQELMSAAENLKSSLVSVRPDFYHPLWSSPTLLEMVERYRETPVNQVKLYLNLPHSGDRQELLALAKTGAGRFDAMIEEWFETLSDDELSWVYDAVFRGGVNAGPVELTEILRSTSGRNRILIAHLWARKLMQEPPEGSGVSLAEYRDYMGKILAQTGRLVVSVMRQRELDVKQRKLVRAWPIAQISALGREPVEIPVNGDLYNQWLKDGGTPEILFGALLEDRPTGCGALLAEKVRYENTWRRKEQLLETTQRFNRFNHALEAIQQAMTLEINQLEDDDLVVERGLLHQRLRAEVAKLQGTFYEDWYCVARKLVCCVIFPHTDAFRILRAIDEAAEANPGIDIREAALLATIEIVSLWVAKLCKLNFGPVPSAA